jgi:hypothetical protein
MVAAGMYIIKSLVTESWSWGGFAKSLLIGAITGGAGGQLLGMYSATTFNGAVVLGSMNGAIGGGVEAIFNGNNFFTGLYRGAVMGGAMAGLSNAIYSLCNNNSYYVYDNGPTNANSSITPYEANYNIQKTKLQLFGDTDVGTYGVKGYHYDPDLPEGVVARTQISRFSRKSEIFFSKQAVLNKYLLAKTMLHETAHSYIRFIYGFNNEFSKKINLLGTPKNSNYDDLLDSVEHFGIRFSEQTFGNLNYLSHTVSFDNPANLVDSKSLYFYFNKLSL